MILPSEYRMSETDGQPGLFFSQRVTNVAAAVRERADKKGVKLGNGRAGDEVRDFLGFKREAEGQLDLNREIFETLLLQLGVKRQLAEIAIDAGVDVIESIEHLNRDMTGPKEYPELSFIYEFPVRMVTSTDLKSLLTMLHHLRDAGRYFLVREITVETRETDPRLSEGELRVTVVVAGMTFVSPDKGKFPGMGKPPVAPDSPVGSGKGPPRPRNYQ
jgi:hypothetical protein